MLGGNLVGHAMKWLGRSTTSLLLFKRRSWEAVDPSKL
jgi:hypothetical protein